MEHSADNLKSKVAHGLLWKILELAGAQGVQFVVALILARLMTPAEYGTIGLIMIFITIANVFVQSGFATALIQRPEVREEDYSSVLRICLGIAVPVYILLWLIAPFAAHYYRTPVLESLLRVMGIVLFPGAVISIQTAYVSRNLNFRQLFKASMFAVLLSGVVSVGMASAGFGVWAMAAQQLVYYFALMGGLFVAVRWRPRGGFDLQRVGELYRFGWKILVSGLIDTIWMNVYGLIIGRRYSPADLGGYSRGEQFPKLITQNLSAAIQAVILPAYARCQDDKVRLKSMMRRSVRLSAFVVFPMMAGLIGTDGILTMLILKAADEFLCTFINAWPVKRLIGYGIGQQYLDMLPAAVCAAVMGAAVRQLQYFSPSPLVTLVLQIAAGVLIYGLLSAVLNRAGFRELLDLAGTLRKKNKE